MKLKELPDWSNFVAPLSAEGLLRSAKSSQLGHFVILTIECQGVTNLRMIHIGPNRIERILAVLHGHIGRSLREISELELGD
jgi:hypothetical protein